MEKCLPQTRNTKSLVDIFSKKMSDTQRMYSWWQERVELRHFIYSSPSKFYPPAHQYCDLNKSEGKKEEKYHLLLYELTKNLNILESREMEIRDEMSRILRAQSHSRKSQNVKYIINSVSEDLILPQMLIYVHLFLERGVEESARIQSPMDLNAWGWG